MSKTRQLSDVWLKASILGATWAASEIILGSFLHNLRIPFNGNILTAIGFILLIAASYQWKDKGLFWRSGLICALMKTMSPSAVIFGPMIAILMESLLLEISVRLLGRNILGFIIGTSLAMSWILFQKIVNFIIFYGFDIVEIYTELISFAARLLHTDFDLTWVPVLILLIIYVLFGLLVVFTGMKIGRSLQAKSMETARTPEQYGFDFLPKQNQHFRYSVTWLFYDFTMLVLMLFLINMSPLFIWIPATMAVVTIWVLRYQRGLRQLSKPSFWIGFALITMLTAFVITGLNNQADRWLQGLITGLKMNFRAAVVIVGFTVLGTELYNPKIRHFFARTSFRQLPLALELAFESLPMVIRYLPEVKTFFTRPGEVIRRLLWLAGKRFDELQAKNMVILLTGDYASGKTSFLKELIGALKERKVTFRGFYSPRIMDGTETVGYDLTDAVTGETMEFLRNAKEGYIPEIGKYRINYTAIDHFDRILSQPFTGKILIIIDEVGKLEAEGKGWYESIRKLHGQDGIVQLWVVRTKFVPMIIEKFDLIDPLVLLSDMEKTNEFADRICEM
ncbi:MAG TPA: nucleoside-triphosphatase, partial [Saprospiraceae bacterium]|nr:nucleoside-triphosphatase [Saprospiraceae bacterium]